MFLNLSMGSFSTFFINGNLDGSVYFNKCGLM